MSQVINPSLVNSIVDPSSRSGDLRPTLLFTILILHCLSRENLHDGRARGRGHVYVDAILHVYARDDDRDCVYDRGHGDGRDDVRGRGRAVIEEYRQKRLKRLAKIDESRVQFESILFTKVFIACIGKLHRSCKSF